MKGKAGGLSGGLEGGFGESQRRGAEVRRRDSAKTDANSGVKWWPGRQEKDGDERRKLEIIQSKKELGIKTELKERKVITYYCCRGGCQERQDKRELSSGPAAS